MRKKEKEMIIMADQTNKSGYGFEVVNPYQAASKPDENSALSMMFKKDDMLRIIQEYLNDVNIPDASKKRFYGLNSKFLPITFFDKEDVEDMIIMQENAELIEIMRQPPQAYTFDMMQSFEQDKILLKIQIKRAIGSSNNRSNERILQNTQISQLISSQTDNRPGAAGGIKGMINKVFG
jgi:hypothetical protein